MWQLSPGSFPEEFVDAGHAVTFRHEGPDERTQEDEIEMSGRGIQDWAVKVRHENRPQAIAQIKGYEG